MKTAFVTGANRGLGLEFVTQLIKENFRVIAGCRNPESAHNLLTLLPPEDIIRIDVGDSGSIDQAARIIEEKLPSIDWLINNAGLGYDNDGSLATVSADSMIESFTVNALGPLMIVKALCPLLKSYSLVANISSKMGSVEDNGSGAYYSYRTSKAALNMISKNLSLELLAQQIIVLNMHPGWVITDMGGKNAPLTPEESIRGMIGVFKKAILADSGKFLDYNGQVIPW